MADGNTQDDGDQLFDTDDSDNDAADESTSDEQVSDSPAEEIKGDLSLEEDKGKSLSTAEQERQKQINVWHGRIKSGEVTIDQLPANLKWMKPHLLERIDVKEPDIEEIISRKLAEKEDAMQYESLKQTLSHTRLTSTQKKELESEYKDLRAAGLSKAKALAKSLKIVGVEANPETASEELRHNMLTPRATSRVKDPVKHDILDPAMRERLSGDDRLQKLEELRTGGRRMQPPIRR